MGCIIFVDASAAAKALAAAAQSSLYLANLWSPEVRLIADALGDYARQAYFDRVPDMQAQQQVAQQQDRQGQQAAQGQHAHAQQLQQAQQQMQQQIQQQMQHKQQQMQQFNGQQFNGQHAQHAQHAQQAQARMQQQVRPQIKSVFVSGFKLEVSGREIDSECLRAAFGRCGELTHAMVYTHPHTGRAMPISSLVFRDAAGALAAMQAATMGDASSGLRRWLGPQLSVAADAHGMIARQAYGALTGGKEPPTLAMGGGLGAGAG